MERVLEKRGSFGLIIAFFLLLSSSLASRDHIWAGWLLVPFKYNPIRFLPDVAVELFVAIECCHIHSTDANDIANLNDVR